MIGGLRKAMEVLRDNEERLRELDAALGDGDLGFTVVRGATALTQRLQELKDSDISTVLTESGVAFNKAASSTFGTLLATAMIAAGRAAQGKEELTLDDMAAMMAAAVESVQKKGKAKAGDKTFVDVLIPVSEKLQQMAKQKAGLQTALRSLVDIAKSALEATAALQAKTGRASWLKERSVGVKDGGATAVCLIIQAFVNGSCKAPGKM